MKRRWPLWLGVAAALLVLADAALWYAAQQALARGFARWTAQAATRGVTVTAGPASRGGFPLTATRTVAVSLRVGAALVHSERVVLELSPARPASLRVRLPAPVAASLPRLPAVTLASPDWRIDLPLGGSGIASTDARTLEVTTTAPGGAPRRTQIALLHLQAQPLGAALDLTGSAQSIVLPEPLADETWPLGRRLASVAFEAALSGSLPPPRAPDTSWPDAASASAWRESGGRIELRRVAIGYGPLGLAGSADLSLDAQLQPAGQAALRVLGYADTLDALVAAHVIDGHAARAAGAVLALLARPPQEGAAPEVALDLTLRDRVLTAAGFPLLRLSPLAWPGA